VSGMLLIPPELCSLPYPSPVIGPLTGARRIRALILSLLAIHPRSSVGISPPTTVGLSTSVQHAFFAKYDPLLSLFSR